MKKNSAFQQVFYPFFRKDVLGLEVEERDRDFSFLSPVSLTAHHRQDGRGVVQNQCF
jgi:hypothetical protein